MSLCVRRGLCRRSGLRGLALCMLFAHLATPGCREPSPSTDAPPAAATSTTKTSTPSERPSGLFTDITASAGLDFRHVNGAAGNYRFPEIMGAGCALWDYDNDGDLDIYALQGGSPEPAVSDGAAPVKNPMNQLYRNDSTGLGTNAVAIRFTNVTEASGLGDTGYAMGCAIGDYDNDGFADVYVTNYGSNALYRNHGDGTFSEQTTSAGVDDPRWSTSAAFVDYDQDGFLDLFVTNYVDYTPQTRKRCVSFHTGAQDYCVPSDFPPVPDRLFRNLGNQTFADVTASAGISSMFGPALGVVCADFNDDHRIDIYVANDATANLLWINQGDGTFREEGLLTGVAYSGDGKAQGSMGVLGEDFDLDGDFDIFVTNFREEFNTFYVSSLSSLKSMSFEDRSYPSGLGIGSEPLTGFGTVPIDHDNDGDQDIFVANGAVLAEESQLGQPFPYALQNKFYRNLGHAFEAVDGPEERPWLGTGVGRGAAMGDVDNDGDLDLLISNNNGPLRLLRNNVGQDHRWVTLQLVGARSNRDALGAEVYLKRADGTLLRRRVARDGSYCSSSDSRVHFGLGNEGQISSLTIRWPSGLHEQWPAPPINRQTKVVEGTGTALAP